MIVWLTDWLYRLIDWLIDWLISVGLKEWTIISMIVWLWQEVWRDEREMNIICSDIEEMIISRNHRIKSDNEMSI